MNARALDKFLTAKAKIDAMIATLQEASENHFNVNPDEIHWGHVGDINRIEGLLREVTDVVTEAGELA